MYRCTVKRQGKTIAIATTRTRTEATRYRRAVKKNTPSLTVAVKWDAKLSC